jgi:hypothetical protein
MVDTITMRAARENPVDAIEETLLAIGEKDERFVNERLKRDFGPRSKEVAKTRASC